MMWEDFRPEPVSDRPEIEVRTVFIAECPICDWSDTDGNKDDVESAASIHADWHENGMPE